jgi:hypothetical protein
VKPLSVYVAGASSERAERAQPVIGALSKAGFTITHDWTAAVDMHGANNEHGTLTPEELAACAHADLWGVKAADVFVLLAPQKASTGAWAELGVALMSGCRVYVAGKCEQCIFTWLPQCERFETDAELVEFLSKKVQR